MGEIRLDTSTILALIFVLIVDIIMITIDLRNKLIISGTNKFRIIAPLMIAAFIIITIITGDFKLENIIIGIELLPLAVVGNKSGITTKGLLMNSYVTPWDKIESYSLDEDEKRYIVSYKTNIGSRKIFFKLDKKEEVREYLQNVKKLRYKRK